MKKIFLTALLSVCVLLTACKKDETISADKKTSDSSSVSETSAPEVSEPDKKETTRTVTTVKAAESSSPDSIQETNAANNTNSADESSQSNGNISIDNDSQYDNNVSGNDSDFIALGQEQFEKSCKTKWNFLVNCPYELDYSSGTSTGAFLISDSGVSSTDDIINQYCQVFEAPDDGLYSKYFDSEDGVYCYDGGRGANAYYTGTELELVSQSDSQLVFNAVSEYSDGEESVSVFSMVMVDGVWKTESFTLPY